MKTKEIETMPINQELLDFNCTTGNRNKIKQSTNG